jgi:hypothetical protein
VATAMLVAARGVAQPLSIDEHFQPGCAAVAEAKRWADVPPEHQDAARACMGAVSLVLLYGKKHGICPSAPVSQPEAAAVVARHLDENPDDLKEQFRSVAREALSEQFPCKESKS